MRNVVKIVGKEKLGKSGYVKLTAIWNGSEVGYNRTGSMIVKEGEAPDVSIDDVFEAVTYYAGKENRFELI